MNNIEGRRLIDKLIPIFKYVNNYSMTFDEIGIFLKNIGARDHKIRGVANLMVAMDRNNYGYDIWNRLDRLYFESIDNFEEDLITMTNANFVDIYPEIEQADKQTKKRIAKELAWWIDYLKSTEDINLKIEKSIIRPSLKLVTVASGSSYLVDPMLIANVENIDEYIDRFD